MNTQKGAGPKPEKKLTVAEYIALGYRVVVKDFYLNSKKQKTANIVVVKQGAQGVYFNAVPVDGNIPVGGRHLTLAEYVSLGFVVKVKRFFVTEADLPAADVILEKRGEKPVYLNGVYGKDENVPGGRTHRFGKTAKETMTGVLARHEKNKKDKGLIYEKLESGKNKTSSAERAGLGKGQGKKDHKK